MIGVTNWEKVEEDDFYLTDDWLKEQLGLEQVDIDEVRARAKNGNLYLAYVVSAVDYAVYSQMDAHQIIIDLDFNEVVSCESVVIDNTHDKRIEWE